MGYKIQTFIFVISVLVFGFFIWFGFVIGICFPQRGMGLVYLYMLSADFALLGCFSYYQDSI